MRPPSPSTTGGLGDSNPLLATGGTFRPRRGRLFTAPPKPRPALGTGGVFQVFTFQNATRGWPCTICLGVSLLTYTPIYPFLLQLKSAQVGRPHGPSCVRVEEIQKPDCRCPNATHSLTHSLTHSTGLQSEGLLGAIRIYKRSLLVTGERW